MTTTKDFCDGWEAGFAKGCEEAIEECAKVAEECLIEVRSKLAPHIGNAIRALKDK